MQKAESRTGAGFAWKGPRSPAAGELPFLTWSELTETQLFQYQTCSGYSEKMRMIYHWLSLNAEDKQSPVVAELFFNALRWCEKQKFSAAQMSTFFSILKLVHEKCVSDYMENLEAIVDEFRQLLVLHSVERPPISIGIFTGEEAQMVSDYMIQTYFRHYKMYKYVFTPKYTLSLSIRYDNEPEVEEEEEEEEGDATVADGAAMDPDKDKVDQQEVDKTKAEKELRAIISVLLKDHMKKLKGDVDQQMKTLEETLTQQLANIAGGGGAGAKKRGGK